MIKVPESTEKYPGVLWSSGGELYRGAVIEKVIPIIRYIRLQFPESGIPI